MTLCMALLFAACEKTLDIEEPADRELVLNAVPAAGRQPFVHFAYTRFFLDDNNDQPVPGAQLTLYVNDTVRPLVSMEKSLYYFADTLRPDDRLRLDIEAGGRSVHAETYVPLYPAVSGFSPLYLASETFNFLAANFYLDDHAGRDEYYNITVTVRDSGARFNEWLGRLDTVDTVHSAMFTVPNSPDITSSEVASYSPLGGRLMFLDRHIDGQQVQVPLWIMHGTADKAVNIKESKKVVNALEDAHNDKRLRYDWLKGQSHGALARIFYMKRTYEWLFRHSLSDEGRPLCREYKITKDDLKGAYQDLNRDMPDPEVIDE